MKQFRPGQIVLLAMPFTDTAPGKRRPALVIADTGDEDIVVARITSQRADTSFDVDVADWQRAGLLLPSIVRAHKVATLDKQLVDRVLGSLSARDMAKVETALRRVFAGAGGPSRQSAP